MHGAKAFVQVSDREKQQQQQKLSPFIRFENEE